MNSCDCGQFIEDDQIECRGCYLSRIEIDNISYEEITTNQQICNDLEEAAN